MNDVCNAFHSRADTLAVRNVSSNYFKLFVRFGNTVVTEGANLYVKVIARVENLTNEMCSYFARRSRHEDVFHRVTGAIFYCDCHGVTITYSTYEVPLWACVADR